MRSNNPLFKDIVMTTYDPDAEAKTKPSGYSGLQIGLHWLIAALVLFQLVFGESMTRTVDAIAEGTTAGPFDVRFASLHFWSGIAILALVGIRLIVRLTRGVPPAQPLAPYWSDMLARLAHGLFYVLLVGVPVTGLLGYYVEGPFGDIHAWAKPVFIGLIALHAAAALYHQFLKKDGTLTRMLKPNA
jgi:cytochrome b561